MPNEKQTEKLSRLRVKHDRNYPNHSGDERNLERPFSISGLAMALLLLGIVLTVRK